MRTATGFATNLKSQDAKIRWRVTTTLMRRTTTALVFTPKMDTIATATASMMQMATAYAMNLK